MKPASYFLFAGMLTLWSLASLRAESDIVIDDAEYHSISGSYGGANLSIGDMTWDDNEVSVSGLGTKVTDVYRLYVGKRTWENSLSISNGASVSSTYAYIGKLLYKNYDGSIYTADSNTVTVSGFYTTAPDGSTVTTTSSLQVASTFYIGDSGSYNNLTVTNGGVVTNNAAIIGNMAGASNNAVFVSGRDSVWTTKYELTVGNGGASSALIVTGSGVVSAQTLSIAKNAGSSRNTVEVSGEGSTLTVSGSLVLGVIGSHNTMTISDGGKVFSGTSAIGSNSMGLTTIGNAVSITGAGSVWATKDLTIYSGNALTLENGGLVKILSTLTFEVGAFIGIDGGYLAWQGDHGLFFESLVEAGYFQIFNTSTGQWEICTDPSLFNIALATTNEAGSALTNGLYDDLGGYTVVGVPSGKGAVESFSAFRISAALVPEPNGLSLLGIAAAVAFSVRTFRRRNFPETRSS